MRRPRHAFLHQVTAAVHAEVEEAVDDARFFDAPAAYCDYLRRMHHFHVRMTIALSPAALDLARRCQLVERSDWLAADLASLGLTPLRERAWPAATPTIHDRAAAFGALYVLQGASLGARVLVARARRLSLPPGAGLTYLTGLASTSEWGAFLDCLEDEPDLATTALAHGAVATFESVFDHLTRSLPT